MAGEKRWNGVAILDRWAPVLTRQELPGDPDDGQSRYLEAAVNGQRATAVPISDAARASPRHESQAAARAVRVTSISLPRQEHYRCRLRSTWTTFGMKA
jgi:exonuclease III